MERYIFNIYISVGLIACLLINFTWTQNQTILQSPKTTCFYLEKYGAACETHKVTTEDGYILILHRVKCNRNATKGVAFLQHGLLDSSSGWVILGNNSLGLYLCNSGYDVWLGNARGNRYSREHITLSKLDPRYWRFSWHEMGIYDVPAMIDYILKLTQQNKLHYVGHSQGTTQYLVYASTFPEKANNTIISAHLLAPIAYSYHMKSLLTSIIGPVTGNPDPLSFTGDVELLPNTILPGIVGRLVCALNVPIVSVCDNLYFIILGYSKNVKEQTISELLQTVPAGAPLRSLKHYEQLKQKENTFRPYDFGSLINSELYGNSVPVSYLLGNISVKTYGYYGGLDILTDPIDVERTFASLNPNIVKRLQFYPSYNHGDVLFSDNVLQDVNVLIQQDIASSKIN